MQSIINGFWILEVQSYFIRVNITEELGCYPKDPDEERCYLFTPFKYIKQYSNNNTRKFRDMKLRLHILGVSIVYTYQSSDQSCPIDDVRQYHILVNLKKWKHLIGFKNYGESNIYLNSIWYGFCPPLKTVWCL